MKICDLRKRKEGYFLGLGRKAEMLHLSRKRKHLERTENLGEDLQRREKRKYNKIYREKNKEKLRTYNKRWVKKNRKSYLRYLKRYSREYFKVDYRKNADKYKERSRRRYRKNKKWYAKYNRQWLKRHRDYANERHRKYMKGYRGRNRKKLNAKARRYYRKRYLKDINWTIGRRLSARLRGALKIRGMESHGLRVFPLLGCSVKYFKHYIEKQFKLGMTWKNIQIDHIRPIASFNLKIPKQQEECFYFKNMRPLWPPENNRKGSVWRGKRYKRRRK